LVDDDDRRPLGTEAVAQSPGEVAESFLGVGSEIVHLVHRERPVRREPVPHVGSGVHFRGRAPRFLSRLYATASVRSSCLAVTRKQLRFAHYDSDVTSGECPLSDGQIMSKQDD
jgi:hypothetical protein